MTTSSKTDGNPQPAIAVRCQPQNGLRCAFAQAAEGRMGKGSLPATGSVTGMTLVARRTLMPRVGTLPLLHRLFALYDLFMVSDEQIQKWADEAEAGYGVEELKRRGRGRPGRGAEPMQVVAVRLTAEEIAALDELAERKHLSRSEAIRRALADFAA